MVSCVNRLNPGHLIWGRLAGQHTGKAGETERWVLQNGSGSGTL